MRVLVFAEQKTSLEKLCQCVGALGERVEAIVIGEDTAIKGADKVWQLPVLNDITIEGYTESIIAFVKKEQPEWVVFPPSKRCKLIAGRLAAAMETSVLTDVMEIEQGIAKRMVFGGAAVRQEKVSGKIAVAMIGYDVFAMKNGSIGSEYGTIEFVEPIHRMKVLCTQRKEKIKVDLANAKKIIGVGRGIGKEEDLTLIRKLAEVIQAEVGCSRPIAESEGWMPKESYVGVSGLMLVPEVYVAVGISGQVQHMVGINRAKVIIAINKDKNAPIFKQADYGIVADLYKVVPLMVEKLCK